MLILDLANKRYMKIDEDSNQLRPSLMQIQTELRRFKRAVWFLAILLSVLFGVLWPMLSVLFDDFSYYAFQFWIIIGQLFICASLVFFLLAPIVERFCNKIFKAAKNINDCLGLDTTLTSKLPTSFISYSGKQDLESNYSEEV